MPMYECGINYRKAYVVGDIVRVENEYIRIITIIKVDLVNDVILFQGIKEDIEEDEEYNYED